MTKFRVREKFGLLGWNPGPLPRLCQRPGVAAPTDHWEAARLLLNSGALSSRARSNASAAGRPQLPQGTRQRLPRPVALRLSRLLSPRPETLFQRGKKVTLELPVTDPRWGGSPNVVLFRGRCLVLGGIRFIPRGFGAVGQATAGEAARSIFRPFPTLEIAPPQPRSSVTWHTARKFSGGRGAARAGRSKSSCPAEPGSGSPLG